MIYRLIGSSISVDQLISELQSLKPNKMKQKRLRYLDRGTLVIFYSSREMVCYLCAGIRSFRSIWLTWRKILQFKDKKICSYQIQAVRLYINDREKGILDYFFRQERWGMLFFVLESGVSLLSLQLGEKFFK